MRIEDFLTELMKAHGELPAICEFGGFHSMLIHYDTLHVCYRGFGPDLVASALLDFFPKSRGGLTTAHDLASSWAKACNLELSCDEFVINTEEKYAYLNCKGADTKILLLWLVPGTFKDFRAGFFSLV